MGQMPDTPYSYANEKPLWFLKSRLHCVILLLSISTTLSSCFLEVSVTNTKSKSEIATDPPEPDVENGPINVVVEKVYPDNGSGWMEYIKGENGGSNHFDQPDDACTGLETGGRYACIHGGDKLKVRLNGHSSCSGFKISDNLEVFQWHCQAYSDYLIFLTTGFQQNKGLADLVDFSNLIWLENSVKITYISELVAVSQSSAWWSTSKNPIVYAPDSSLFTRDISGYSDGTILIIPESINSNGFNINQDRIALVTANSATVTAISSVNNCQESSGELASPDRNVLICSGSQKFLWVEGNYNPTPALTDQILLVRNVKFSTVINFHVASSPREVPIHLLQSTQLVLTNCRLFGAGNFGFIYFSGSTYNTITHLNMVDMITSSFSPGLLLDGSSTHNAISNVKIYGWSSHAISIEGDDNIISKILSAGSSNRGIRVTGDRNTLSHVTTAYNNGPGVSLIGASFTTVNQILSVENSVGFSVSGGANNNFAQLALFSLPHYAFIIEMNSTSHNQFMKNVILHDSPHANRCAVSGGTLPGTNALTCGNQAGSASNANWTYFSVGSSSPLIGQVTDSSNANGITGASLFASISDFINFESVTRLWTRMSAYGRCGSGDTCIISDFRLRATDSLFRNRSNFGSIENDAFVKDALCPAAVQGIEAMTDQQTAAQVFLSNAEEIVGDSIGDDDGLCESFERCLYSPNFGYYQGIGDYLSNGTCHFNDGLVEGVVLYSWPIN